MKTILAAVAAMTLGTAAMAGDAATVTTLGGLENYDVSKGEFSLSAGAGMAHAKTDEFAVGVGVNYGVRDDVMLSVKAAHSVERDAYSAYVGVAYKF